MTADAVVYTQRPCAAAMSAPSASATILTQLLGGTQLRQVDTVQAGDGSRWVHAMLWGTLDAYIADSDVGPAPPARAEEGVCSYPGLPDAVADPLIPAIGPWPLAAQGQVSVPTELLAAPDVTSIPKAAASVGQEVVLTAWVTDAMTRLWYRATIEQVSGWLPVTCVRLALPDLATHLIQGSPAWQVVAGKGMWFQNYLPHHSDIEALVQAARQAGLSHLYAEVAISRLGFYGRNTLDRLLPVAHAAGIKVIGWVYPYLQDIATDVRLTQEVALYQTPSGDKVDGVASDMEEVTSESAIYSYGQVLRALLGPDEVMVANVLHPLTHASYPYGALAGTWNVVAPMDYWHGRHLHAYSAADVRRFVQTSLTTLQAVLGTSTPIEEVGQTYDMYTDDGAGERDAPTAAELAADLAIVKQLHCIGASYFAWQTASPAEWQVLSATRW
jgi:hypothetical protein